MFLYINNNAIDVHDSVSGVLYREWCPLLSCLCYEIEIHFLQTIETYIILFIFFTEDTINNTVKTLIFLISLSVQCLSVSQCALSQ